MSRRKNPSCLTSTAGGIRCCAFLWILLCAGVPVQAQTTEFGVSLSLASMSDSQCTPNAQEQAIADFMRQDPRQQRDLLRCDPILARVAKARAEDMGDAATSAISTRMAWVRTISCSKRSIDSLLFMRNRFLRITLKRFQADTRRPKRCGPVG